MPDPLPILDQAIERNQQLASKIQDYEIETKQLRETMGDQANEITELKTKEKKMQELQSLVAQYDKNIGKYADAYTWTSLLLDMDLHFALHTWAELCSPKATL